MFTFNVKLSTLRAARTHAAEKDVRYYLNGVCFDLARGKAVATDGHRLFIADAAYITAGPQVIVSNDTIDAALKQFTGIFARGKNLGDFDVAITVDGPRVTIQTPTGNVSGELIDAKFPDYQRVIPSTCSHETAQYNARYLAEAAEALAIFYNAKKEKNLFCHVFHNGDSSGIVTTGKPGAAVIIMPLRSKVELTAEEVIADMTRPHVPNMAEAMAEAA